MSEFKSMTREQKLAELIENIKCNIYCMEGVHLSYYVDRPELAELLDELNNGEYYDE